MHTNVAFYIYKENIRENIERTPCILPHVADTYKVVVHFKARCHHMYIHEKKYPYQQWLTTQYRLIEEEMGNIMASWDNEWNIPLA
jgi:hypothetical protein